MQRFEFIIKVIGYGETEDEAWKNQAKEKAEEKIADGNYNDVINWSKNKQS